MMTIDAQVHCYERNHPGRPWTGVLHGPAEMTGDQMVAAMDAVGVDGAILVSPYAMYRHDGSYAVEVHAAHPTRFALVKPVDPTDPAVADVIAAWAKRPGTVGVRLMMNPGGMTQDPNDPGIARVLKAAAQHKMVVNLMCWERLDQVDAMAAAHPDTRMVVDHLGIPQPFDPPKPAAPWAALPKVLGLAKHANLAIKISGAGTLAHQPFPYPDIWDPLRRILDAWGLERCLWGTDWTRAVAFLTYKDGVEAFRVTDRLSDSDRATLMGGALTRVYGWAPAKA
jgi:predicted TIM-barrel fold metal-dependent hydrolase